MSENKYPHTTLFMVILILVLVVVLVITLISIGTDKLTDNKLTDNKLTNDKSMLYDKTCKKLVDLVTYDTEQYYGWFSESKCIQYLEENSNLTGQDVFDHFEIKTRNQLLTEPIIVPNSD